MILKNKLTKLANTNSFHCLQIQSSLFQAYFPLFIIKVEYETEICPKLTVS